MNDVIAGLIEALGERVSPVWTDTFAAGPGTTDAKRFRAMQGLVNRYGAETVRYALETALEGEIVPKGVSAFPLLNALCSNHPVTT